MYAKTTEYGFYYEFSDIELKTETKIHILQVNQKTNEMKDFFWNAYDHVKSELRRLNYEITGLTSQEVCARYLPELCHDNIHEWVQVEEEDFHK